MRHRIDWTKRGEYMTSRHTVTPTQANEAVNDPNARWANPDPKSKSGKGIRVIGYSANRDRIITVILIAKDTRERIAGALRLRLARFWGVNGWPANTTDQREYMFHDHRDDHREEADQ